MWRLESDGWGAYRAMRKHGFNRQRGGHVDVWRGGSVAVGGRGGICKQRGGGYSTVCREPGRDAARRGAAVSSACARGIKCNVM